MKKTVRVLALLLLATPTFLFNCSEDDPAADNGFEYFGTSAPGDSWSISGNESTKTFTILWDHGTSLNADDDVIIAGSYNVLSNGAYKLTINGVSPAVETIPSDGTAILYGIVVPGTALILNPAGSIEEYAMITMSLRREGELGRQDGNGSWNMLRTAYPRLGYNHIDVDGCWGTATSRVDAAAGMGYNLGSADFSLSCAESDIDPNVSCVGTAVNAGSNSIPVMSISEFGALEQISGIDTRKFTGQLSGDIIVTDNGEGGGGQILIRQNASLTVADFSDDLPTYSGLTSSYDRSVSPSNITEHFLKMQFVWV